LDLSEHEDNVNPPTKRTLPYGWDGSDKNLFFVDSNGISRSIVTVASAISTSLSGNMTLNPGPNQIGSVTISHPITATFGGNVTLNVGPNQIGSVTISHPITATFGGNTTLNPSPNQIGSVTISHPISATFGGNVTLNPSPNWIGLATAVIGSAPTLFAVVNTSAAGQSSIVLDTGANWIGLATVQVANIITETNSNAIKTAVETIDNAIAGSEMQVDVITMPSTTVTATNLDIRDLTSVSDTVGAVQSGNWDIRSLLSIASLYGKVDIISSLPAGTNAIGKLAANSGVDIGDIDILSIAAGDNNIGNVDVLTIAAGDNNIGNVDIVTLPALIASSAYIGLATVVQANQPALVAGSAYVGLASVNIGGTLPPLTAGIAQIGSVTIANQPPLIAGGAFIGLATIVPDFGSNITVFTGIYSAAGAATLFVAPASNRFWLQSIHIASLGRSEVEIRSGATTLIPFTSLATTGGYVHNFEQPGLPSRAQADAFVINLGSAATISVMASTYFKP